MQGKVEPVGVTKVWMGDRWENQNVWPGDLYKEQLAYLAIGKALIHRTEIPKEFLDEMPRQKRNRLLNFLASVDLPDYPVQA